MTYGSRWPPVMSVCARSWSVVSSFASQSRTSSRPAYTSRAKSSDMNATSQPSGAALPARVPLGGLVVRLEREAGGEDGGAHVEGRGRRPAARGGADAGATRARRAGRRAPRVCGGRKLSVGARPATAASTNPSVAIGAAGGRQRERARR